MIMNNNIKIFCLVLLFPGTIPVSSIESRESRSHGFTIPRADSLYHPANYDIPTSANSNHHHMYQQREIRKLAIDIFDEAAPITKEYGLMGKVINSNPRIGKGIEPPSKGTMNVKGKGSINGEGGSMGKGGNDNVLPMICYNVHNMEGELGKGKGHNSETKSKSKSKRKGAMYNNSKKAKYRRLKGSKRKGKSAQINTGKGNDEHDKCSNFGSAKVLKQRSLYSSYSNLLDIARGIPEITVFVSLLYRFDLSYLLECEVPFTGLIPTNDAFSQMDPISFADLLLPTSRNEAEQLILNHLFLGKRAEADFMEGTTQSLSSNDVSVSVNPLVFNMDATTVMVDIFGSNGVLHLIDKVLLVNDKSTVCDSGDYDFEGSSGGQNCVPNVLTVACSEPKLSIFLTLIETVNLQDIFTCNGPFTVLAPTNEAFDAFEIELGDVTTLSDLLLYHVLPGLHPLDSTLAGDIETLLSGSFVTVTVDPVRFDNGTVLATNNDGCNGIVHIVDSVLTPGEVAPGIPSNAPATAPFASIRPTIASPSMSIAPSSSSIVPFMLETNAPTIFPNITSPAAPTDVPIVAPATALPSTSPSPSPIPAPNATIPTLTPAASPLPVPSVTISPIISTTSPVPVPSETIVPTAPTIQPSPGTPDPSPISGGTNLPSTTVPTAYNTSVPSDFPTRTPNSATISPAGAVPTSVPTVSNASIPSDFPSLTPNRATIPPAGAVPTSLPIVPNASIPSDFPSLTPIRATISPTAMAPSITTFPIGTLTPSTFVAPAATTTPTQTPASLVNTTSPISMKSDIPSLMPQITPAAPTTVPTTSIAPSTLSPTPGELRVDLNEKFYIAFISLSDVEPTPDEYEQMAIATEEYYNEFIRTSLMTSDPTLDFIRVEMPLNVTQANAGVPDDRFNIYMEFSTALAFFEPNGMGNLITSADLLDTLLNGLTIDFLLDPVRMQTGTPFADVTEGFLQTLI